MFPHLYLKEDEDRNPNNMNHFNLGKIECNFFDKHLRSKGSLEPEKQIDGMRLPSQIQLKFDMRDCDLKPEAREYNQVLQKAPKADENSEKMDPSLHFSNKYRSFQMDMNLNQYKQNVNHSPTIMFDFEKDGHGKPLENADFFFAIELSVPAPFFEKVRDSKSGKEKFNKIVSPMQLNNDLLNYWNLK